MHSTSTQGTVAPSGFGAMAVPSAVVTRRFIPTCTSARPARSATGLRLAAAARAASATRATTSLRHATPAGPSIHSRPFRLQGIVKGAEWVCVLASRTRSAPVASRTADRISSAKGKSIPTRSSVTTTATVAASARTSTRANSSSCTPVLGPRNPSKGAPAGGVMWVSAAAAVRRTECMGGSPGGRCLPGDRRWSHGARCARGPEGGVGRALARSIRLWGHAHLLGQPDSCPRPRLPLGPGGGSRSMRAGRDSGGRRREQSGHTPRARIEGPPLTPGEPIVQVSR